MRLLDAFALAVRGLANAKLQSAVSLLGTAIGTAAVTATVALGTGAQEQIRAEFASLGANVLFVRRPPQAAGSPIPAPLTLADARANEDVRGVVRVAPEFGPVAGVLAARGRPTAVHMVGVTKTYAEVRNVRLSDGRWFESRHVDGGSTVVVLGSAVAALLADEDGLLPRRVRLGIGDEVGVSFEVIGLAERRGGGPFGSQDEVAFVPITTLQRRFLVHLGLYGPTQASAISVRVADGENLAGVAQAVEELFPAAGRGGPAILAQTQGQMAEAEAEAIGTLTVALGAIAGISTMVSGIGATTVALGRLGQRVREIGLRRAVGARQRDVFAQLLSEALLLASAGAVVGMLAGLGGALLVQDPVDRAFGGGVVRFSLAPPVLLSGATTALVVGLAFGLYPSFVGCRIPPVKAMGST